MKIHCRFTTFLLLIAIANSLSAQKKNTIEDLKVALTFKLCEYITWPNDTTSHFTITILSGNNFLIEEFNSLALNYTIKKKPIVIKTITNPSLITKTQVLYVDETRLKYISEIWNQIIKKNILLFTENHTVAKEIMFNLLPDNYKGTITFEFNRANLIFEGFDIHADIIELRGSEIDVRELYRQTKTRLEKEEYVVRDMQTKLDSQKQNITKQENIISKLSSSITEMNYIINNQTDSIHKKEETLNLLASRTEKQQNQIKSNLDLITQQKGFISQINSAIQERNFKIAEQHNRLDSLNKLIGKKQTDLTQKTNQLVEKDILINLKNNLIYLMTALIFLIFMVVFLILRAYRTNKTAQSILAKQKEELEITLNKLTQTQAQLIQAEKMASLGILTAGIAHEINNPVNFINSGIQGLQKINKNILKVLQVYRDTYQNNESNKKINELEEKLDLTFLLESSETMVNNIRTGVDRTVNIIKSLRAFTRADEEVIKPVDIHENIDLALTILYNQYKYRIEVEKQYNKVPLIYCYPGKINQVFMNILTNAIQAISDTGTIWITTHYDDQDVIISIKDSGMGIPPEIKSKIFDPFFTTKEVGKGTGMGLSIVFTIIEEHHGKIDVISEPGKGTEFIITLPISQKDTLPNKILQQN